MPSRYFIAISVPDAVKEYIQTVGRQLLQSNPQFRIVGREHIHSTLFFFPAVSDEGLATLCRITATVGSEADNFALALGSLVCFPSAVNARVVTCGVNDVSGAFRKLHTLLKNELNNAHFGYDSKTWIPHVTVGRLKEQQSISESKISQDANLAPPTWQATKVNLYRSDLGSEGLRYTVCKEVPLRYAP
ncbi:RNA 2',3'-cyclic phosphodiesterase [Candidatus Uhrbacteria bacterium CG10_big_fil_rev_8_21_14_0_10_48_11]|uniref:RNA 2',3'-cyclic phosphodiesterase n=1 Tax=Candidatus Uhrbacteria bacterium CG10_big_fil_rev_8_21_14_0_10_48_11 TaxID=1975037 RepID=A0A2M8LEB5_9BACT|nr:MAG: RNA 2',3'-cyclic phosphodiesterase [Candidatus Uhrbacteria bacterium CG10_big_fil_rev_8_21_14_0_10_48_11]